MRTVYCFHSKGWFSCHQVIFLNVLRVFVVKRMQHLSEKTQFPGFFFPQLVTDFDEICHGDAVLPSWPVQPLIIWNFTNPRWRRPPSWKNQKIAISWQRYDWSPRNLTRWHNLSISTLALCGGCSYVHIGCFCGSGRHLMLLMPLIRKLTYRSWAPFSKLPKIILRFA